jgi:arylamine N-acetyltransferase
MTTDELMKRYLQRLGPPFDHLALVITLPEAEFLTDVGFGDNLRADCDDVLEDYFGIAKEGVTC